MSESAPLPFDRLALVESQGGEVLGEAWVAIWPTPESRETSNGEIYDWAGEAEAQAAALLVRKSNRQLRIDDALYKVVTAIANEYVPHVALRLREMRAG